jgi:Leucine rich repeat
LLLILAATIFIAFCKTKAKKLASCNRIATDDWSERSGGNGRIFETCFMNETSIETIGVDISQSNESVTGLILNGNKKIFYLPENVPKSFPNLTVYFAINCSISNISSQNFKGMDKLTDLALNNNSISKVTSDTFNDLIRLVKLYLGKKRKYLTSFQLKLFITFSK